MSLSVNLSLSSEVLEFEKHDGYENSVKHLGQYYHQLRGTEGKKKENVPIVIPGENQSSRSPTQQYDQSQSRAYTLNLHAHLQ